MPADRPPPGTAHDPRLTTDTSVSPDATHAAAPAPPLGGRPFPFLSPPARPDDLGQLGPYRVVRLLGEGGMGFVFRGEDDALRPPVALKVMRPEVAAGENARERFMREGRAAAALKSDHVVTIYQVGEANGVPFLAMEYLDGCTLDDWLKGRGGAAAAAAVVKVAKDVLRGLAAAHDKGLIHRDIKPANLWLEAGTGRVKVLDFGLTRGADDVMTREGALVGTPSYMAPEQAAGRPVDGRADLFSLGVVLYRMAVGRNPFQRGDVWATLTALAVDVPPPAGASAPGLPPDLGAIIDRLVAKPPDDRPASARAALAAVAEIERAMKGGPAVPVVNVPVVYAPPAAAEPNPWAEVAASVTEVDPEPASVVEPAPTRPAAPPRQRSVLPLAAGLGGLAIVAAGAVALAVAMRGGGPGAANADPPPADPPPRTAPAPKPPDDLLVPAPAPEARPWPSPFDALDPAKISAAERVPWLPKETVAVIGGHRGAASGNAVALSPDGKWVAATQGSAVILHDAATLEPRLLVPHVPYGSFAFSPDGTRLAHTIPPRPEDNASGVRLLDLTTTPPSRVKDFAFHGHLTTTLAFSADGKTLVTGTADVAVHLWDVAGPPDAGPRTSIRLGPGEGFTGVRQLLPAAGGRLVAVLMRGERAVVRGWDVSAAEPRVSFTLPERSDAQRVAVAPAGDRLVLPWFNPPAWTAELWDVSGPTPRLADGYVVLAQTGAVGFAADGSRLVVSSPGDAQELGVRAGKLEKARELLKALVAATPDLSRLVQASDSGLRLRVLDGAGKAVAEPGELECFPGIPPIAVRGRILTTLSAVRGWTVEKGGLVAAEYPLPDSYRAGSYNKTSVSADGRFVAGIGSDVLVRVLAVEPGGVRPHTTVPCSQTSAADHAADFLGYLDGKRLAIRYHDGSVGVWDVTADPPARTATWAKVGPRLAFAPTGDVFAEFGGEWGGPITLRRVADPKATRLVPGVPDGDPVVAAFAPDGRSLYVDFQMRDTTERLVRYDLTRKQPAGEVVWERAGAGPPLHLEFSRDGRRILSCVPGRVVVVDAVNRAELMSAACVDEIHDHRYSFVGWADDGRHVLVGQCGCVYVLRVPERAKP